MIPLNSDTETQPTAAMREAIACAKVGDEQQGRDPNVNELQERVAALLGKEAALWFPGGTMCNFVAVKTHTQPCQALLADRMAHILRAESGGVAMSSGVFVEGIPSERGIFTADQLAQALERLAAVPLPYSPAPGLLCVEQTHNFGGGSVWSLDELRAVSSLARERGLPLHMDGARLMNAVVASGTPAHLFAAEVDSLWLCFTKGLGAPVGAVLAGSRAFIASARRHKHAFGGAMRQAGMMAAGCLYALDHHIERLAEDHQKARDLAQGLAAIPGLRLTTANAIPESNMVFFDATELGLANEKQANAAFVEAMFEQGIRLGLACGKIRAVTHLDIRAEDIETTLAAARFVAQKARGVDDVWI